MPDTLSRPLPAARLRGVAAIFLLTVVVSTSRAEVQEGSVPAAAVPAIPAANASLPAPAVPPSPALASPGAENENDMETTVAPMGVIGKRESRKVVQGRWQRLLDQTLPLALGQIRQQGSFYPFAALLLDNDEIRLVTSDPSAGATPRIALATLREEISALATKGRVRAVIYYADAEVSRKDTGLRQSGIRMKLDHFSGDAVEGFLPYVLLDNGSLRMLTPEYRPTRNVTFRK